MSIVGNAIGWTTWLDITIRGKGALVHRTLMLVGSEINGEKFILECGVEIPKNEATETQDPTDCMGCMLRRTTTAMEVELAKYNEAYP